MSPQTPKASKEAKVGDDLGGGFILVETREGYSEARNDAGVNISSSMLDKVQERVESYNANLLTRKEAEEPIPVAATPEAEAAPEAETTTA